MYNEHDHINTHAIKRNHNNNHNNNNNNNNDNPD